MKFTNLFLMAGALLSAASVYALDITVKNATTKPLDIYKGALNNSQITVKTEVSSIAPNESVTFTLRRVGEVDVVGYQVRNPEQLLSGVKLSAANRDYPKGGWRSYIRAGDKEHYFENTLNTAHVTVNSEDDVTLDQHSGGQMRMKK